MNAMNWYRHRGAHGFKYTRKGGLAKSRIREQGGAASHRGVNITKTGREEQEKTGEEKTFKTKQEMAKRKVSSALKLKP